MPAFPRSAIRHALPAGGLFSSIGIALIAELHGHHRAGFHLLPFAYALGIAQRAVEDREIPDMLTLTPAAAAAEFT